MKTEPEFDSLVPPQTFNRRSFLVTSLGAGFAIATQPVMAQTAIKTDEVGLIAGEIQVPVKDGEMVAYRAVPGGMTQPPVVLVVSEIFGAHEYIRDTCRRLAKLGYCAIAPDLFARQGDPRQIASIPEILDKITNNGGFMAVTDKSPPEAIYKLFGVSKKVFKQAIGSLYKNRLILIEDAGLRIITQ